MPRISPASSLPGHLRGALVRSHDRMTRRAKGMVLLAVDGVAGAAGMAVALRLWPEGGGSWPDWVVVTAAAVLAAGSAAALGLQRVKLIAWDGDTRGRGAVAATLAAGLAGALPGAPGPGGLVLMAAVQAVTAVAARAGLLQALLWAGGRNRPRHRALIHGAGATGRQLAAALRAAGDTLPVAFLDDDAALHGLTVAGLRVHPPAMAGVLARRTGADRAFIALPGRGPAHLDKLAAGLRASGLAVLSVPSHAGLLAAGPGSAGELPVLPVRAAGRAALQPARAAYAGASVLVTGAGGSVGGELCRQLLPLGPRRIVLLDASEAALYTIDREMRERAAGLGIVIEAALGSVTDGPLMHRMMRDRAIGVVLHAAACKHVPLAEANPLAAASANVIGTLTLARAAAAARVARFVLISTDKAVNPAGVMGATKRLAEAVVRDLSLRCPATAFAIVRFGNVLGSSGSVVPLFRDQIARGGPVTITHPEATRWFMTADEAARLVLIAGAQATPAGPAGCPAHVLDMGEPLRIADLARRMIASAGLTVRDGDNPSGDIAVEVTGLRPGEKLHEELACPGALRPTAHPRIRLATDAGGGAMATLPASLRALRAALRAADPVAARAALGLQPSPGSRTPPPTALPARAAGAPLTLSLAAVLCLAAGVSAADLARPALNLYGATGLIDMPSALMQPDGELTVVTAHAGPLSRTTLSFQATPRLSAAFRFSGVRGWNRAFCPPDCTGANQFATYYDRSFDLRFQIVPEGRLRPALAVGLQDFAGTGVLAGEYVVATKTVAPGVTVTLGAGWGRLGGRGGLGEPFGPRPSIDIGFGGRPNGATWFRGPAAAFGGVEWRIDGLWTLKAEYSGDTYAEEAGLRRTFRVRNPVNVGVERQLSPGSRIGFYVLHGSVVGIAGQFALNPVRRPGGNTAGPAPVPVVPRAAAGAAGWDTGWVADRGATQAALARLGPLLAADGLRAEGLRLTATTAELRLRITRQDSAAEALGRAARAMAAVLPASVERFDIMPLAAGMAAARVTLPRSALENLQFSPGGAAALRAETAIAGVPAGWPDDLARDPALYPALAWSVAPYTRLRLFDQNDPAKADLGLRATARWEIARGLTLSGALTQRLAGTLRQRPPLPPRGRLQPVRSAVYWYDVMGTTAVERLAVDATGKLSRDVYARLSAGWLERMFGGIAVEVLWKPADSRFAVGAEIARVAQRSPDGGFGFRLPPRIYETDDGPQTGPSRFRATTGHLSAYWDMGNGFHARLDVGRYLAGDIGATLAIDRAFANGWRLGAFATKTDVSAADFGSGSFDKGIRIEVPLTWVLGQPTRARSVTIIRPFGRDGGARLDLAARLYDEVRAAHGPALDRQWGRVWK
ncbi:MAG TPA: YjbH domain-containing protein [Paracoccaceae bacterium]|nr:YjbH domain-containing protein [Paracoccaceae bacterium]